VKVPNIQGTVAFKKRNTKKIAIPVKNFKTGGISLNDAYILWHLTPA